LAQYVDDIGIDAVFPVLDLNKKAVEAADLVSDEEAALTTDDDDVPLSEDDAPAAEGELDDDEEIFEVYPNPAK
jgi:hypothetical protein